MSRILWIHAKPVLGGHGGAELRTRTLVQEVLGAGHEVLLAQQHTPSVHTRIPGLRCLDLNLRQDRMRYLEKLRSPRPLCAQTMRPPDLLRAKAVIAGFAPELTIVSELVSLDLADQLMPAGVPWIYEAHNVEPELFARLAASARSPLRRIAFAIDARRFARDQARALATAQAVAAVSPDDLAHLKSLDDSFHGVVVASSVPPQRPAQPGDTPPTVLFVGMLSYLPNVEAAQTLLRHVMPAVLQQVPDARLVIAGRDPRAPLRREAAKRSWCEIYENVRDLGTLYRAARCVAIPLQTGSGTRLKTYEAMSYGVPVVGTPVAFTGIPIQNGTTGFLAHDTKEMSDRVVQLLRDPDEAARMGAASHQYYIRYLSPGAAAAPLLDLMDTAARRWTAEVTR